MIWTFDLIGDRDLTAEEIRLLDTVPAIYEGDITPEYGGGQPVVFHCDITSDSLDTAVRDASTVMMRLGVRPCRVPVGELAG